MKEEIKREALTVVIFGGTGDLAMKKLIPAFSRLIHHGIIKKESTIIGVARGDYNDYSYKEFLKKSIIDNKEKHYLDEINIRYVKSDFSNINDIEKIANILPYCEIGGCNRIYYLATGYKLFPTIVKGLKKYNLISKGDNFSRIVFEKPFGNNVKSYCKLRDNLIKVLDENQIFRIDHYLGKESVQNINILKSTNAGFWEIMNNKKVDEIEVVVSEDIGVGNRIGYYNEAGAIRDMIQNHLLQVLSLVLMEKPKNYSSKEIHKEKLKILNKLELGNLNEFSLGQYNSFKKEAEKYGFKNSKSETYAKIILNCKNKRWNGTKLVLISGKKLPKRYGRIIIKFKNPRDRVVINLQPRQDITAKLDGKSIRNMKYCIECGFKPNSPDAYESLFKDVINNDKSLFVTSEEVYWSWKLVDKIEKLRNKIKFVYYKDGTYPEKTLQ